MREAKLNKGGESLPLAPQSKLSSAPPSNGANNSTNCPVTPQKQEKKKLSFKEQKEFEELDKEIPALEEEAKKLEAQMASSDFSVVQKASQRYKEISTLLEKKYQRWEELSEFA